MTSSAFLRYWLGAALSAFGTAVTAVALPVLVIQLLGAGPFEVGVVNAAQFVPYAVLGFFAGVFVDRWPRRTVLVWAGIGRAVSLALIPLLWWLGVLQVWLLVCLLLVFGAFAVFGFAATQSFLPRLVPRDGLVRANARLDQADNTAQTLGPTIGGGLVGVLGAPVALLVDSVSYLAEAALNASLRVDEPRRPRRQARLRTELGEGWRATYRHPTLGPLAVSTHVWFVANGMGLTVLSLLTLRTMGLTALGYGLLLTTVGFAALLGATLAPGLGSRLGTGWAVIASLVLYPPAWLLVAAAPSAPALLFVAMVLHGFAGGVENPNSLGYRQAVTPDGLLGRVNGIIRSANRTMGALGALLGGAVVGLIGTGPALATVIVLFTFALGIAALSPLRTARLPG
ncbi:MFS transporter [Micropruina sonneratiae]|uniref:MFS transporter n=1 Tax=Micropruina sonneratiae TaxID=2986940 RepID=UPI0029D41CDE|nr:MFS transporter [Micropruina sp. KQZ13P-5]